MILYDEAKNSRNQFVTRIQNCSQDLAEMKERIKILQNEVEILRNESAEKDRLLLRVRHDVATEVTNRDRHRKELNKKELEFK